MAKAGNHGRIIPRDRELLHRLYVIEKRNLSEMARMFGVTNHKSVGNVLRQMGFPMPGQGCRPLKPLCIDCKVVKPRILAHKLTKNGTGTRCHECLKKYKRQWLKKALKRRPEEVRASRKKWLQRWYEIGPINPKGELQWIRKSRALLRSAKRALRAASQSPSAECAPEQISRP